MEKDECALVWMSAGNSYFKEDVIMKILDFSSKYFNRIIVMAPDEPAEHTFRALGYKENEVKRKTRLNANLLQNRAKRVIDALIKRGVKTEKFKLVEWNYEIIPNKNYQDSLKSVNNLYNKNKKFRKDARDATKKVIVSKIKEGINIEKAIDEAVKYLLKELAFILASLKIYRVNSVTYIYHQEWKIYENIIKGDYDKQPRGELKFLLFR